MENNLKFLVDKGGVNLSEMARSLDVSRSSLYNVLNGGTPSAELMLKISTYFKKDVSDIFFIPSVPLKVQKSPTK